MLPKLTFLISFFPLIGVIFIDFCGVLSLICFKINNNRRSGGSVGKAPTVQAWNPSSGPQHSGTASCLCNPRVKRPTDRWGLLTSRFSSRFRDPISQIKRDWGRCPVLISGFHTHVHAHTRAHTRAPTCPCSPTRKISKKFLVNRCLLCGWSSKLGRRLQ